MQVTNNTPRPIYASQITGADGKLRNFEIMSGDSVDVDERTAMILGEYGAMVDRSELDPALIANDDPRVEPVVSPWDQHGPGTNERGYVVDEDAAAAHADILDGDTSKSVAAMVRTASQVVPTVPADAETVSSGGTEPDTSGDVDTAADGELKGAALDEALRERSLSTSGTADEKRARVAQYDAEQESAQAAAAAAASGSSSPADTSPSSSTTSTPTT